MILANKKISIGGSNIERERECWLIQNIEKNEENYNDEFRCNEENSGRSDHGGGCY